MERKITQVKTEHYNFELYSDPKRFASYYYQIKESLKDIDIGQNCLIIGKGDGIVSYILKEYIGEVDTFDFDESLNPDYIGDVRKINEIINKKYDVVICCQVLEHVEYNYFEDILSQLSHICTRKLIISLPYCRIDFSLTIDMHHFRNKHFNICIPKFYIKNFPFNGEHYWEVGIRGKSKAQIKRVVNKYFRLKNQYNIPENTYHWFLILEEKEISYK